MSERPEILYQNKPKDGEGVCSVCNSLMYDGDQYCPECGRKVDR